MAFNAQGRWVPEDQSAATKLTGLLASNSPYIKQAQEAGTAMANKRGLLNSSIAAGNSEASAIAAAAPIAEQDASQIASQNLSYQGAGQTSDLATQQAKSGRRARPPPPRSKRRRLARPPTCRSRRPSSS
jgi:hypothetical protein